MIGEKKTWRIEKALGMAPQNLGNDPPDAPIWLFGLMPDRYKQNSFRPTQRVWYVPNALSNSIAPGRMQVGGQGYQIEYDVRTPAGQFTHALAISNGMPGYKGLQQVAGFYVDGRGVLGFATGYPAGAEYDHLRLQEFTTPLGYLTYTSGFASFASGGSITALTGLEVLFVSESDGVLTQVDWFSAPGPYTNQIVTLDRPPIYPNSVQRVYLRIIDVSGVGWYFVDETGNPGSTQLDPGSIAISSVLPTQEVGTPHIIFSNLIYNGRRFGLAHQVAKIRIPSVYPDLNPSTLGTDKYTEGAVPNGLYFSDAGSMMSEGLGYITLPEPINEIVHYQEGILAFCNTRIYYVTGGFTNSQDVVIRELPQAYQYGLGPNPAASVKGPLTAKVGGKVYCVANSTIVGVELAGISPVGLPIIDPTPGDSGWGVVGLTAWQGGNWLIAVLQKASSPTQAWVMAHDPLTGGWFAIDFHDNHVPDTLQVIGPMDHYASGSFGLVRLGVNAFLYGRPNNHGSLIEDTLPRQVSFRSDLGAPRVVKLIKEITVKVPFQGYVNDTNTYVEVRIGTEDGGTGGNYTTHKMKYHNNGYWRITPNVKSAILYRFDFLVYGSVFSDGNDLSVPNASRMDMPIEISFIPVREFR